jgi:menaquinone-specific isochorismate synthase
MGGYPQHIGFEVVARLEPVTRGWFAAPVGWLDAYGNGMFAVAIRSAVSSGKRVRLYAGAGIVADSDPRSEYNETIHKASAPARAVFLANALVPGAQ